jgi:6-phosphogluconate dehydrogenase
LDKSDIGIIGLGLMGRNLSLNLSGHGFAITVFDPAPSVDEDILADFLKQHSCNGFSGARTLDDFVGLIRKPRKIMMMLKAGKPVDDCINRLIPCLEPGDIIIDGGNSHYLDTARRLERLEKHGILFVGCGVSGGGEGALHGPSLMPGGSSQAWDRIRPLLQKIAAKLDDKSPCCEWIGPQGSGHFVKMVHNGIEYALMQVIAESYDIMKRMAGMTADEIALVISGWNRGELKGYLTEITAIILKRSDDDGKPLVDKILDSASEKGTGKDASRASFELGVPIAAIDEAVSARFLSLLDEERRQASREFTASARITGNWDAWSDDLRDALYCSMVVAYAQGFAMLVKAGAAMGWDLDRANIAHIWRGGSIIQSDIMKNVETAFKNNPSALNILLVSPFIEAINQRQSGWRRAVSSAVLHGIPAPVISSTLAYFDSYRSERLPANLIQAMRDCFGAHGYERIDAPQGTLFHTDWKK